MNHLESKILQLIESKREGSYWDFKQEPHDNKASLLHDILSLSNSLYRGNKFLIYGIADPTANGVEIIGLTEGQINRKSQAQFIDFLRSKQFAGDCRPEIELHTLKINGKEIDVLEIFDNPVKPYYLIEEYRDKDKNVKANFIYTRTNDTNTPIDKSTDIGIIEKMWQQRFGLDLSPLERMKLLLLRPKEWFKDIGNKPYSYHLDFPEFRIEFSKPHEFWEVFSFFFPNEKSFLGSAAFKYHSTTLFELQYMYCDEMRIELAVPETANVRLMDYENWFYYYNLEELSGFFLQFITDNFSHLHSRGSRFPFVIFNNTEEKKFFIDYLISNENTFNEIQPSFLAIHASSRMKKENRTHAIDPLFIDKVVQFHEQWTKE